MSETSKTNIKFEKENELNFTAKNTKIGKIQSLYVIKIKYKNSVNTFNKNIIDITFMELQIFYYYLIIQVTRFEKYDLHIKRINQAHVSQVHFKKI